MNTVLYFSASGAIYETRAYSKADIDELVHEQGLQCLTSADRQFDFWFSTSTHGCQRRTNQSATELLLATTTFTARRFRCSAAASSSPPMMQMATSTDSAGSNSNCWFREAVH